MLLKSKDNMVSDEGANYSKEFFFFWRRTLGLFSIWSLSFPTFKVPYVLCAVQVLNLRGDYKLLADYTERWPRITILKLDKNSLNTKLEICFNFLQNSRNKQIYPMIISFISIFLFFHGSTWKDNLKTKPTTLWPDGKKQLN